MAKILIVDDESAIRVTFKLFLTKEGHDVSIAENVEVALQLIDNNIDKLDLIITDIIMPKITGISFLKIIKEKNPRIPVIIMTGEPTVETATISVKNDAQDYLVKPVTKHVLLKTVNSVLEKKRLQDENYEYKNNLEKLVSARTKVIVETINATISTIASILKLRDQYTAGHEQRVGNLAVAIGKKLNLEHEQLNCLSVSGYLHDIGKISIPAEILSKPGRLDDLEYEMVKRHSETGYNILKNVNFPWPVADVVLQHHERINGSGYPNSVKQDDLMIESKIIAVADVVEAMTSHRPYRAGLGLDAALEEIEKNKGILYDSEVVSATIDLFRNDRYEFDDSIENMEFEL